MQLNGLHHVTAISAQIGRNVDFYTRLLGLRLVKKSVNQDDTSAYHLFYADKIGSPGTDMTFFDWPNIGAERRGTDSIVATVFRVKDKDSLAYWANRLTEHDVVHNGIEHFAGRALLRFDDFEGQRLILMDDEGAPFEGEVWAGSQVPAQHALRGFYAAMLSTPKLADLGPILTQLLAFKQVGQYAFPGAEDGTVTIYALADGGPGREVWVVEEPNRQPAYPGAGGVHHVAFRVADVEEQRAWRDRLTGVGLPVSNLIDRYYFNSIYFRVSNGILFEIATDGPGFATDEDLATLGEKLALPPFLEAQRAQIEAQLKPIEVRV